MTTKPAVRWLLLPLTAAFGLSFSVGCTKKAAKTESPEPPKKEQASEQEEAKKPVEASATSVTVRGPRARDRLPVPADFVKSAADTINKDNYKSVLEGLERDYATQ